jgi:hypothetical protein
MTTANPSESGDYGDEHEDRAYDRYRDEPEAPPESPSEPAPAARGDALAVVALVIPPVAAGVLLACRTDSLAFVWAVSFGAVGLTALLLAVDAGRLGSVDRTGRYRGGAGSLFVGMILLWVVFYPVAYFRRRHFGRPNYGPLALLVAAFFLAAPLVQSYADFGVLGGEPPTCTSREVVSMLDDILRKSSPSVVAVSGHREISYDRAGKSRKGQCLVKLKTETVTVTYNVKIFNPANGTFGVEVDPFFPTDPPECTDPPVIALLERVLRDGPSGPLLRSVTEHEEIRYDRPEKERHGRCRVILPEWSGTVAYKVYWVDQKTGSYQVEIE